LESVNTADGEYLILGLVIYTRRHGISPYWGCLFRHDRGNIGTDYEKRTWQRALSKQLIAKKIIIVIVVHFCCTVQYGPFCWWGFGPRIGFDDSVLNKVITELWEDSKVAPTKCQSLALVERTLTCNQLLTWFKLKTKSRRHRPSEACGLICPYFTNMLSWMRHVSDAVTVPHGCVISPHFESAHGAVSPRPRPLLG